MLSTATLALSSNQALGRFQILGRGHLFTMRRSWRSRAYTNSFDAILLTPAGKITLRIPKLRSGMYYPEGIPERCSRVDKATAEVYATGVLTRKAERVAGKLGVDRLPASQVSSVCERLDAEVAELRAGELSIGMPYLFLDATYVKCRRDNRVQSTAAVTAVAVGADGVKRVVGLSAIDTEVCA